MPFHDRSTPIYPFYASPEDQNFSEAHTWKVFSKIFFDTYHSIPKWLTSSDMDDQFFSKNRFELCTKLNANMLFAEKDFAKNYSKLFPWPFFFFEEEFIMTIESFKMGWIPVFPNFDINICHLYVDNFNEFYTGRDNLGITNRDSYLIKDKLNMYFKENENIIDKYFKYASIDKETRMSTKNKYIPRIEDVFSEN